MLILDHVLIYGERHLRWILTLYSLYYNETRTRLGLGKDTPIGRHIERSGTIVTTPILSGLIIATRGYDFREGQVRADRALKGIVGKRLTYQTPRI